MIKCKRTTSPISVTYLTRHITGLLSFVPTTTRPILAKPLKSSSLLLSFLVFPHETLVPSEGRIRFNLNPIPTESSVEVQAHYFLYRVSIFPTPNGLAKSRIPELIHKLLTNKHKPNPMGLTSLTSSRRCLLWWSCLLIDLLHG